MSMVSPLWACAGATAQRSDPCVAFVLETPSLQVSTNHVFAAMAAGADKEKIEARQTARGRRRAPASVLE
jgi:hypothetical protein